MKLKCLELFELLNIRNPESAIEYVTKILVGYAEKKYLTGSLKGSIFSQLQSCMNHPIMNNYAVKFRVIKILRQSPLAIPRHMLELKASNSFATERDLKSILKAVTEECASILRLAGIREPNKYIFKSSAITKVKRTGLIDKSRPSDILEANILYNALLSLNKNSPVDKKDRLYIAVEEISSILHEARPIKANIVKNGKSLYDNGRTMAVLTDKIMRLTGQANHCEVKINSAKVVVDKINSYDEGNRLNKDKNDRVMTIYRQKMGDLDKYPADLVHIKEELRRARESIDNIKAVNELLTSTMKSDNSLLLEAASDLREALELHAGITFKRSFIYNLTKSNRDW